MKIRHFRQKISKHKMCQIQKQRFPISKQTSIFKIEDKNQYKKAIFETKL